MTPAFQTGHDPPRNPVRFKSAIDDNPAAAGVSPSLLDEIAASSIHFEARKSSAMSFAAGLPGGFALLATVPTDITQFYFHAFRVMQKIAYVYGWRSLINDTEEIDDETLGKLASLLGVMLGVSAASGAVTSFATNVARPAVEKHIAKAALTKTGWYGPMKQVLRIVGVKVTKQSLANVAAKGVPIVGGVVSGGMTLAALEGQGRRLMRYLRELPPPHVDAAAYLAALRDSDDVRAASGKSARSAFSGAVSGVLDNFRAVDLDGDGVPDEPRAKTAFRGVASSVKGGLGRLRRPGANSGEQGEEPSDE